MPAKKSKSKAKSNVRVGGLRKGTSRFSRGQMAVFAVIFAAIAIFVIVKSFADTPGVNVSVNSPVVGIAGADSSNDGYWLAGQDGGIFTEGTGTFHGSNPGIGDVVGMSSTHDLGGYWLIGSNGAVYAYGDAQYNNGQYGSNYSVTGMAGIAGDSSDGGYWAVDTTGHIYAFGGAPYLGAPTANLTSGARVVGIAATPSGNGYWVVTNFGQVYTYGDAQYDGNAPNGVSNIVGITAGPPGSGYWLVGSDGGVFAMNAPYYGSMGGVALSGPVVGIDHTSDYGGYWLAGSDGAVYAFGDAQYQGRVEACPAGDTGTYPNCVAPAPKPIATSTSKTQATINGVTVTVPPPPVTASCNAQCQQFVAGEQQYVNQQLGNPNSTLSQQVKSAETGAAHAGASSQQIQQVAAQVEVQNYTQVLQALSTPKAAASANTAASQALKITGQQTIQAAPACTIHVTGAPALC